MNDLTTEEVSKLKNMQKIPQSFMNELERAVRESDGLKAENTMLTKKNGALQVAFEKLMEMHQEIRIKMGWDDTTNELWYDLYNDSGVLDFEE
jgi:hypothetical protein